MSKIKINDLKNINVKPSDAESFINDLLDNELKVSGGCKVSGGRHTGATQLF